MREKTIYEKIAKKDNTDVYKRQNLLIPLVIYVAMFCADWKLALMSLASIPISLLSMVIMYLSLIHI